MLTLTILGGALALAVAVASEFRRVRVATSDDHLREVHDALACMLLELQRTADTGRPLEVVTRVGATLQIKRSEDHLVQVSLSWRDGPDLLTRRVVRGFILAAFDEGARLRSVIYQDGEERSFVFEVRSDAAVLRSFVAARARHKGDAVGASWSLEDPPIRVDLPTARTVRGKTSPPKAE